MYSFEDYKWTLNPCLIRLMCIDNTRVNYLSEKDLERRKAKVYDGTNNEILNDMGIPIFGLNSKENNNLNI